MTLRPADSSPQAADVAHAMRLRYRGGKPVALSESFEVNRLPADVHRDLLVRLAASRYDFQAVGERSVVIRHQVRDPGMFAIGGIGVLGWLASRKRQSLVVSLEATDDGGGTLATIEGQAMGEFLGWTAGSLYGQMK